MDSNQKPADKRPEDNNHKVEWGTKEFLFMLGLAAGCILISV